MILRLLFSFIIVISASHSFAVSSSNDASLRAQAEIKAILQMPILAQGIVQSVELIMTNNPWDSEYYVKFIASNILKNCESGVYKAKVFTVYMDKKVVSVRLSKNGIQCSKNEKITEADEAERESFGY